MLALIQGNIPRELIFRFIKFLIKKLFENSIKLLVDNCEMRSCVDKFFIKIKNRALVINM